MKNKFIRYFLFILFLPFVNLALANEDFIFESNQIEYKNNNNQIIAKGNVKITSSDDIYIYADESEYFKLTNELFLNGNVKIVDEKKRLLSIVMKFNTLKMRKLLILMEKQLFH